MVSEAVKDFFWLFGLAWVPFVSVEILIQSIILGLLGQIELKSVRAIFMILGVVFLILLIFIMPKDKNPWMDYCLSLINPVRAWSVFLFWVPLISTIIYNLCIKKSNVFVSIAIGLGSLVVGAIIYLLLGKMVGAEAD